MSSGQLVLSNAGGASDRTTLGSTEDYGVPLSTAGRELRAMATGPLADRAPIGYQREFLDGYAPRVTQYLTESLRRHLHELGRTPDHQRPAGTYARDILKCGVPKSRKFEPTA
jgi:hypothetical protein